MRDEYNDDNSDGNVCLFVLFEIQKENFKNNLVEKKSLIGIFSD